MTPAARRALLVFGIVLAAANLRPAIVALAPLLEGIREETGLSGTGAGLLTTLPVLCFGLLSPVAPVLARRFGTEVVLIGAMLTLALGSALRLAYPVLALFAGTAVIGAAVAVGNVLVPSIIKQEFSHRTGVMTGLHTMSMSAGAVVAAGLTIPVQGMTGLGWRSVLALWGVVAAVAAAVWLPLARTPRRAGIGLSPSPLRAGLWRNPLAWQVTAFMGLQSFNYYATTAWLPTVFSAHNVSAVDAGWLLAAANVGCLVSSFIAPLLAGRNRARQPMLVVVTTAACAIGLLGLVVSPTSLPYAWVTCLGAGQGMAIGLALTMIVMRASDAAQVARLSGMAQTVGYLFAATGPFAIGALHDATGGWTMPLLILLVMLVPMLLAGLGAARDSQLDGERPTPAA